MRNIFIIWSLLKLIYGLFILTAQIACTDLIYTPNIYAYMELTDGLINFGIKSITFFVLMAMLN